MRRLHRIERGWVGRLLGLLFVASLGLIGLSTAAQAQDFVPTDFEAQLCDARKAWEAAVAEEDRLHKLKRQYGGFLDDAHYQQNMDAVRARHETEEAFLALYHSIQFRNADGSLNHDVSNRYYKGFFPWCTGRKSGATPSDVMGLKTGVFYRITLFMPEVKDYAKAQVTLFSGRKEAFDFNRAQISGRAIWQTTFFDGPASDQVIKAVLWKIEDGVWALRAVDVGRTDGNGGFVLNLPIRASAGASRLFDQNIKRGVIDGFFPDGFIPPAANPQGAALKALVDELPPKRDFAKFSVQSVTKLYAVWKDAQRIKSGKPGSPHLDQWKRNHAAGRDNINALGMLIDVATSPATAHAQVAEAANNWYKRLTGSPLPGVTEMTPAEKADLKKYYQHVWDRIGLNDFIEQHGRLPEEGEIRGLIE